MCPKFMCFFRPLKSNHKGVAVLPTPDGIWHRDSHYRSQLIGEGVQVAEFYKGKIGGHFITFSWIFACCS